MHGKKTPLEYGLTSWNGNVTNTLYTNNVKYYGKKYTSHQYIIHEDSPALDFFSLDLDFNQYQV
jgi:hypothetical protein